MNNISRAYLVLCVVTIFISIYYETTIVNIKNDNVPRIYAPSIYHQYIRASDIINIGVGDSIYIANDDTSITNNNTVLAKIIIVSDIEDRYLLSTILWINNQLSHYGVDLEIYYNKYSDMQHYDEVLNAISNSYDIEISNIDIYTNIPAEPYIMLIYVDNNNHVLLTTQVTHPKIIDQTINNFINVKGTK